MAAPVLRWQDQAVCKEQTDLMFREDLAGIAMAKALCATCPVAKPCLEDALAVYEQHGVWGGYDAEQRHHLRGIRKAETAAKCGTRSGYVSHRRRGQEPCQECRIANRFYTAERREVERAISRDNKQGRKP